MKKKMLAVLVAMIIVLAAVGAQAVGTSGAASLALRAKSSVDTVSSSTKKTKKKTKKKAKKTKAVPTMAPMDELTPAASPLYPVGTQVVIRTDHMPGMQGATGVVSGAYDTTLFAVDYSDESGNEVKNHRWVTLEEIVGSMGKTFAVGDTVTLAKGHMESMGGVGMQAVIVQVINGPAYMVDYDPTDGSARVLNHKWVAEFELESADSAS